MFNIAWRLNNKIEKLFGVRIERKSRTFMGVRSLLIERLCPDVAIDVGANIGQWGRDFKGRYPEIPLISFEPNTDLIDELEKTTRLFRNWSYRTKALGSNSGFATLNVTSDNGLSSSINPRTAHKKRHPQIASLEQMQIEVSTLDDEIDEIQSKQIFLKIDAQGYENEVLLGAQTSLKSVVLIEMETSFSALYQNESTHHQLVSKLMDRGFIPWCTSVPDQDDTGRFWSCDILLVKKSSIHLLES